jgi:hypothetical protein
MYVLLNDSPAVFPRPCPVVNHGRVSW